MIYKPLKNIGRQLSGYKISMMPRGGIDKESYEQVMDLEHALSIINYIPKGYGLLKRGGLNKIFERAGANPITLLKEFTSGVWIFGYSTKIEAYNTTTEAFTSIKTNFSSNSGFDGARVGEYFFVCNGVDKLWRIDNVLAIAEVAASPVFSGIKAIGARLYGWYGSQIQYSEVDDGSNPPFDGWTTTTAADSGGTVNYRNAGTIRSVCQLGQYTVAFSDNGFFAFYINTLDSNGTLKKVEVIQNYTEDFGGARGAIETPQGIYYVNEAGLWQMVSTGITNTPMSRQQVLTSTLLGSKYFENVDQASTDLVYDAQQKCIFVTCAKDSTVNNLVIGCAIDRKNAFFEIKGWNINRFAKSGQTIYGASSVKTTVYELFSGSDDDGLNIGTVYHQEIPLGTLFHKHSLGGVYAGGFLSPSTVNEIRFDIYNVNGKLITDKEIYEWTAQNTEGSYDEWASAMWGESGWGGQVDTSGLVESFDGGSPRINNLQRLRVKITGGDKLPQIINWIAVKTTQKEPIKRRHITRTT